MTDALGSGRGTLTGKVAVVTGAASGIGRAIALAYAREGAKVVVVDRDGAGAEATAQAAGGRGVLAIPIDVSDSEQVRTLMARTVAAFGRLDILVNSAAVHLHGRDGRCHECSEEAWETTLRVNLRGPFLCCKYALPELMRSGGGSIINLASPTAFSDRGSGYAAYASSKGGVVSLTRVIAADYGRDGVRCNAIVPGPVQTALTAEIFRDQAVVDSLVAQTKLGRLSQPEDLVGIALFLASEASAYATGALFFVDGGITMA